MSIDAALAAVPVMSSDRGAAAARATLARAADNTFSSIRIYLNSRRSWVENGDEEALEMMRGSVRHLTQPEYDAVKALGEVL